MAVDVSPAALQKANEKHEAVSAEYHDKLAEYEKKIEELEKKSEKQSKGYKQLLESHKALKSENTENEKRATNAEGERHKLSLEIKGVKEHNQELRDKVDGDTKLLKKFRDEAEREKRDAKQAKKKAAEDVQHAQSTITNLTQENEQLKAQVNEATTQLQNAEHELQAVFDDTPDLTLTDLIDRARVAKETPTHHPTEESNSEPVPAVSLQQQLDDAGYDSADEKEEQETLGFSTITSVETAPFNPAPRLGFSAIESVSTAPRQPEAPKLSFSAIESVSTEPIEPARRPVATQQPLDDAGGPAASVIESEEMLDFGTIISVSTAPIPPAPRPIRSEVPWFFYPLLVLCALLAFSIFSNLITERRMWAAANDLSRRRVVDMSLSGASAWHPLLGLFAGIDEMIGVGHGILG